MSTWLADITRDLWDIYILFGVTVKGQNHTVSFVDYLYYFLLLITGAYSTFLHQVETCIISTST